MTSQPLENLSPEQKLLPGSGLAACFLQTNWKNEMVIVGRVGHKTTEGHIPVFIGRPSVLGNPFLMRGEQDREIVVQSYRKYLWDCKKRNDPVWQEVEHLAKMVKNGKKLELKCFCSPKKCHGDVIAKAIEYINSGE